jgi:3-hydroxyacyl-[acyl-carrier-protein] dehydratase
MAELDIRKIMEILPHRYPFLLVDRITELDPFVRARGYKNVTNNEPVFTGHFPGNPVLPGVYMIEALAQLAGCVVMEPGEFARRVPYLAAIERAKFRRPVVPGDCFKMEASLIKHKRHIGWVKAEGRVDDEFVVSAELIFSISSDPRLLGYEASVLRT